MELKEKILTKFHEENRKSLMTRCLRLTKNHSDAEDLLQESLYKAYSKIHTYDSEQPILNWVNKIITNTFIDLQRKKAKRVKTVDLDISYVDLQDYSELPIEQFEVQMSIVEIINSLEKKEKDIFVSRFFDGLSLTTISSKNKTSRYHVTKTVQECQNMMTKLFSLKN